MQVPSREDRSKSKSQIGSLVKFLSLYEVIKNKQMNNQITTDEYL